MLADAKAKDRRKYGERAEHFEYRWLGEKKGRKHLYRWRDQSAGVRLYGNAGRKPKVWLGGYSISAVDGYLGAPIAIDIQPGDVNETVGYEPLMSQAIENLGPQPHRGFSYEGNYRFNTERGIGSALPWRQPRADLERDHYETDRYDRHGVPHCRHRGARGHTQGSGLGFVLNDRDQPVVRYRCELGITPTATASCRHSSARKTGAC